MGNESSCVLDSCTLRSELERPKVGSMGSELVHTFVWVGLVVGMVLGKACCSRRLSVGIVLQCLGQRQM